jgi:glycosyltransferase involved in cell wall biosynthesis
VTQLASSPKVHIGLQACQGPQEFLWHGIGRVVRDLTAQLVQGHPELIAGLHIDRTLPMPRTLADFCGRALLYEHPDPPDLRLNGDGSELIYHAISPFWPVGPLRLIVPPAFLRVGARLVVTLHDLIPLVYMDTYLADPQFRRWFIARLRLLEEADEVHAISEATRQDAIRLLGINADRIRVVYNGVSDYFRHPYKSQPELIEQLKESLPEISGRYLYYPAGTGQFRKNIPRLVEAFSILPSAFRDEFQLVISGHMLPAEKDSFISTARTRRVDHRLVLTGSVPDETVRQLYQGCSVCLYPSIYEGFGLPILEAMRCGAPVLTSNSSSMRELMELDVARFDPADPADMAGVIERALTDEALRLRLTTYGTKRSAGFTWKATAATTAECYERLAGARSPRPNSKVKGPPKNIAICTPYPPERSGIADYNYRLVGSLCARHNAQVHIVVKDEPSGYWPPKHQNASNISTRQFEWLSERGYYESIIYCMGNSPFHGYIYDLLKRRPGIVWLHDVRLTDFYRWYFREHLGRDITRLPAELKRWARRYPGYEGDLLLRDNLVQHQQAIYLTGEVAHHAKRILVNSAFAQELVRIEGNGDVPITRLPFATPELTSGQTFEQWPQLAAKYGIDERRTPVISIGIVWLTKCPALVLEAFSLVAAEDPGLVLVFVGLYDPFYRQQVEEQAEAWGLADRIRFTGFVPSEELAAWLEAARCAIQLRYPTNGESPYTVMQCLAAGLPTVVSDHGATRELPDGCVLKVPAQAQASEVASALRLAISDERTRSGLTENARRYSSDSSFDKLADALWIEVLSAV